MPLRLAEPAAFSVGKGDTANGRNGDGARGKTDFTAKRLYRIAQGFSPG